MSANQSSTVYADSGKKPAIIALLVASVAAMVTFGTSIIEKPQVTPTVPAEKLPEEDSLSEQVPQQDVQRALFFDHEVEPRIAEADALNREAADRCIQRITQMVDEYRSGVDPFVSDLTSLSTRFGIIKRMPADWWNKDKRIEKYVESKFQQHLFSEKKLMSDITQVLDDFKDEVDTNQRRMLIQVKSALGTADLPAVQAEEYQPFFEAVADQLQRYSAKQGTASVQNAVVVFVVSETAGTLAGRAIVVGLLARFGTTAVVSTAAGATATAGTTAAGSGAGSVGGPVGAVVGFGIGMAVGLVVDWWMTEQFEAKMTKQMDRYLDTLEDTILHGGSTGKRAAKSIHSAPPQAKGGGLVAALPKVCDRLQEAYRERFYEQLVTGVSDQ